METTSEIGERVQKAITNLQSKGRIVCKTNELGKTEIYLVTEGISLENGERFDFEMPLALTEEGKDLGLYLTLNRQKETYTPDSALRM